MRDPHARCSTRVDSQRESWVNSIVHAPGTGTAVKNCRGFPDWAFQSHPRSWLSGHLPNQDRRWLFSLKEALLVFDPRLIEFCEELAQSVIGYAQLARFFIRRLIGSVTRKAALTLVSSSQGGDIEVPG